MHRARIIRMQGAAALVAACLAALAAQAQSATDLFKASCLGRLDDFAATVARAEAEGWRQVAPGSIPVADAVLANYGDRKSYADTRVFDNPKLDGRYLLAYAEGLSKQMGEMVVGPINVCRLIDLAAPGPLDQHQFDATFSPAVDPEYASFNSVRQVYFASPDAAPVPNYPLIDGRPAVDLGLQGLVLTASVFAE